MLSVIAYIVFLGIFLGIAVGLMFGLRSAKIL